MVVPLIANSNREDGAYRHALKVITASRVTHIRRIISPDETGNIRPFVLIYLYHPILNPICEICDPCRSSTLTITPAYGDHAHVRTLHPHRRYRWIARGIPPVRAAARPQDAAALQHRADSACRR